MSSMIGMGGRFPVVVPDPAHTHLAIHNEGLAAIARIKNPIAVVAVGDPGWG